MPGILATVRALIANPWRRNSTASLAVLFEVQRNGDIGSPRVAGSTNCSSALTTSGTCAAFRFLPPPARRTRPAGVPFPFSSCKPLCSVVRLKPVIRDNAAIPPWPNICASAAATNRRCRSFRYGLSRACFSCKLESEPSGMTVSYNFSPQMSSLFLPGSLGHYPPFGVSVLDDGYYYRSPPTPAPFGDPTAEAGPRFGSGWESR